RWGGTMAEWQGNVQNIRDFIEVRCAVLNNGFLDCYPELDGPYDVVLMADPPEGGRIDLPSFEIDTYTYDAVYFGGVEVTFDADENDGFIFSHWTTSSGTVFTPDEFSEEITVSFTAHDTLTAHFVPDVSYNLTLNVEPANSGSIEIAGTVYSSFPVTIELAESVDYTAIATAIAGYGFSDWQTGLSLSPTSVNDEVTFSMKQEHTLTARFFEILQEVTFEVAPAGVGHIISSDTVITEYPITVDVPEVANLELEAKPAAAFHEFSHWSILNGVASPDEFTSQIEMELTEADVIVANFIELPNEPITIETSPRDAGWIRLSDTLLKDLPYSAQRLTEERLAIEALDRGKYSFSHWEVKFGAGIDDKNIPLLSYPFVVPTHLIAHFEERINSVFIPNSFTPNGDGFNDLLKVYGNEVSAENFRFIIMNRSGQEIWTTDNANDGWNGAVEGSNYFVPPGLYSYFLRYRNEVTGDVVETSGSILLIR
ncbi:MAG: gliding motility-associated C-terminal domain-containing protein, partial [Bacteroidota bacterium]